MTKALTPKQRKYAKGRADGLSRAKAYKQAGYCPTGTDATANRNAIELERRTTTIQAQLEKYRRMAEDGAILDRAQRQALLTELATDTEGARADRIRATDLLCKMSGDYSDTVIHRVSGAVSIEDARRQAWDALRNETP